MSSQDSGYPSDLGIMEALSKELGETGAAAVFVGFWGLVGVVALAALCVGISGLGRDPDPVLLPSRTVRFLPRRIIRGKRLQVPWQSYWPFFGRLYAGTHALVLAASGAGKGMTVLLPALACHVIHWCKGRVLKHLMILDPKAELLKYLVPIFDAFGWRYFVYSFLEEHPTSSAINVIANRARARATALTLWSKEKGTEGHFNRKCRELFAACCEHVRYSSLWAVRELTRDAEAFARAAEGDPGLRHAYLQIGEKERLSILSTISGQLSLLDDPLIRRVFDPDPGTGQPDYRSWETPCAAVACMDPDQAEELAPLVEVLGVTLYGEMLAAGKPAAGPRRGPGAYCYLDEATSMIRLPKLVSWLGIGRGNRTHTAVCGQDLSQMIGKLGKPDAMSAANNAHIKLFGQSEDPETMRNAEQVSGKVRVPAEPDAPAAERWKRTVRRSRLLGEHLQDFEWGDIFVKALNLRRRREVVTMPHPDTYWLALLRRLGAKPWAYRPRGVPRPQQEEVLRRLVVGDAELEASEWVDPRIRRAAAQMIREGWRGRLLAPAGTPTGATSGAAAQDPPRHRASPRRAPSAPDLSCSSPPKSEPTKPEAAPRDEDRAREREAARREVPERARADAQAEPEGAPPANPTVPTWDRKRHPFAVFNGQVMRMCWYRNCDTPAKADECQRCGKSESADPEKSADDR